MSNRRLFTQEATVDVAIQTAYLAGGYRNVQVRLKDSPGTEDTHGIAVSEFQNEMGHIATVDRMCELAVIVHDYLQTPPMREVVDDGAWPGVFEYEVTEPLGEWFFEHSNCTDAEFRAELVQRTTEFLNQ